MLRPRRKYVLRGPSLSVEELRAIIWTMPVTVEAIHDDRYRISTDTEQELNIVSAMLNAIRQYDEVMRRSEP